MVKDQQRLPIVPYQARFLALLVLMISMPCSESTARASPTIMLTPQGPLCRCACQQRPARLSFDDVIFTAVCDQRPLTWEVECDPLSRAFCSFVGSNQCRKWQSTAGVLDKIGIGYNPSYWHPHQWPVLPETCLRFIEEDVACCVHYTITVGKMGGGTGTPPPGIIGSTIQAADYQPTVRRIKNIISCLRQSGYHLRR